MTSFLMDGSVTLDSNATLQESVPSQSFEFKDRIVALEFSPHLWSHSLICVAFDERLLVGSFQFAEEQNEIVNCSYDVGFQKIREFPCNSRITAISWSPQTDLKAPPRTLIIAYATSNCLITVVESHLKDDDLTTTIKEHTSFVNDIAFSPKGDLLASGSDDMTCRLWSADNGYKNEETIYLDSPVVAVKWHTAEPLKLLVGKKDGALVMFNAAQKLPLMSFHAHEAPLKSVDWSPTNSGYVAALSGKYLFVWDIPYQSNPYVERIGNANCGQILKFFPTDDKKLVTLMSDEKSIKITHLGARKSPTVLASVKFARGLTFHQHLPYVCTAVDKRVVMFRIGS